MLVNYYAILGVASNASAEEIRHAFRKAAMAVHPDRGGSHRLMQRINEAWEVLGDARKRREYDDQRFAAQQPAGSVRREGTRSAKPARARPRSPAGPRPPTFARIAGTLFGRALHAIGFGAVEPKARRKAAPGRGAVIVLCGRCGQKLRVKPGGPPRIRCPKCRTLQALD